MERHRKGRTRSYNGLHYTLLFGCSFVYFILHKLVHIKALRFIHYLHNDMCYLQRNTLKAYKIQIHYYYPFLCFKHI